MILKDEKSSMIDLPMLTALQTGRAVIIDSMTDRQLTETYYMIQEAAKNCEGYGMDEYETEKDFRGKIDGSHCFVIMCKERGEMIAAIIIAASKFYRGPSEVADPLAIVRSSERQQSLGEFTMRTAIDFSRRLGYMGMYVDTFTNNVAARKIIEKIEGFRHVGFLPLAGRLGKER
ncbi:uncharacterized protein LOC110459097 [Mizuhopecten yessoensis]|uniref:uncharacterized protein LOC110459097 n=1 Tax=Mizuhopecten yessoensis TaxID=6573 RepID=UPI000B4586D4|nr:uncharacterized protein LOC110459097 [Mizuhopecten yessoensis]